MRKNRLHRTEIRGDGLKLERQPLETGQKNIFLKKTCMQSS